MFSDDITTTGVSFTVDDSCIVKHKSQSHIKEKKFNERVKNSELYLLYVIIINNNIKNESQPILNPSVDPKIKNKIACWKTPLSSQTERNALIKFVALAIPFYNIHKLLNITSKIIL